MSKEVKRYYTTLAFDRPDIAANCSIQGRPATCTSYELTCVVLASDYDALLAERDALEAELADLVRVVGMSVDGSSARNKAMEKAFAALQGAQP